MTLRQKRMILVADRNPHVRQYLKREFENLGHRVLLAENCRELFRRLNAGTPVDLMVIDPDFPDTEMGPLFRKLQGLRSRIPVVIHTFIANYLPGCNALIQAEFVEKDGNSIEALKAVIDGHLNLKPPSAPHLSFPLSG